MELKELKSKKISELERLLAKNREILRDLKFKVSAKQLKNVKEIKKVRKTIARILTLINQKKNEENLSPEEAQINKQEPLEDNK